MNKKKTMDIIMTLVVFYLLLIGALYLFQRNLMYFPDTRRPDPLAWQAEDAQIVKVTTEDGLELEGWYFPPKNSKPVIIYFHGNASNYAGRVWKVRPYISEGYGVLLAEYRGYGGNPGSPSEQGFYKDARAWMKFLERNNIPPSNTVIYGESIGSGVAVQMATEYRAAGLVLEAPFTSTIDVAKRIYFYVPVDLLMKDRYLNIEKISKIHAPVLILHGAADRTIPITFGKKLYDAAVEPRQFITIEKAGHDNLYEYGAADRVLEFLRKITPPSSPSNH